ncbi:hypothetical protein REPUB_Repub13aG0117600 [Reevesia pubescens]
MATSHKTQQLKITEVLVFFLFIFTSSSLSSARLLHDFVSNGLPATDDQPTLNLALPVHDFDKYLEQVVDPKPCDHMIPIKDSHGHVGTLRSPRLAGKYGPMILNMLPKGPVTSSGPSKGTDDVKN